MSYIHIDTCTRCGGAHRLSQCPWPCAFMENGHKKFIKDVAK